MKKIFILFLLISTFQQHLLSNKHVLLNNSEIQNLASFKDIRNELEKYGKNTLVIFDVDDVLISPEDAALQSKYSESDIIKNIKKELMSTDTANSGKANKTGFFQKIMKSISNQAKWQIIEPKIVDIIKQLQKNKVHVIALTAIDLPIKNIHDWRAEQLAKLGINFNINQPTEQYIFPDSGKESNPRFFKGILFSGKEPKGKVLAEFIKHFNLKPELVIAFDDYKPHLESIIEEIKKQNISSKYKAYLYTGAQNLTQKLDEGIIKLQVKHFQKTGKWLSESEIIKNRTLSA